jgi:hypothetical protein
LKRSRNEIILSWPAEAKDFALEMSSQVGPRAAWTRLTTVPALLENRLVHTNSVSTPASFFRLRQP